MPAPKNDTYKESNTAALGRIKEFAIGALKTVTTDLPGFLADVADKLAGDTSVLGEKNRSSQMFEALTGIKSTGSAAETLGSLVNPENAAKAMIIAAARVPSRLKKYDSLVEEAAKRGKKLDRAELFKATDVYVDKDQIPKTYISDKNAKINYEELINSPWSFQTEPQVTKIPQILDAPVLTHLYPEIKDVEFAKLYGYPGEGSYNAVENKIRVAAFQDIVTEPAAQDEVRSVMLHELQHTVQTQEGFTRGGNPRQFLDFTTDQLRNKLIKASKSKDPAVVKAAERFAVRADAKIKEATNRYFNLGGEQEARFTQKTRNMDNAELKQAIYDVLKVGDTPQTFDTRPIRKID